MQKCAYEGKRLNLWSYWQGSLEADILVVGQDWGCFRPGGQNYKNAELDVRMEKNFIAMDAGNEEVCYFDGTTGLKRSDTDENLKEYFKMLGPEFEDIEKKNGHLFFTNLCLGYRSEGFTGGFKHSWIKDDMKYFYHKPDISQTPYLLEILEPQIILCLGKEVYNAVREVFGKSKCFGKEFYAQLDSGTNGFDESIGEKEVQIFGMAHPGNQGTANRYTRSGRYKAGLLVKRGRKKITAYGLGDCRQIFA